MQHELFDQGDRRKFRDRRIPQALLPVLARTKIRAIPEPYCVVSLPATATQAIQRFLAGQKKLPFSSVSADDRECSVVMPAEAWTKAKEGKTGDKFADAQVEGGYRILAIEGECDWSTPGYLPVLGRTLAEANVGAGFLTGYRRLHLIVKARQVKEARVFLDLLSNQAKGRLSRHSEGGA